MKKIIPSFLIIALFLIVVSLWLSAEDTNKFLLERIDTCNKSKVSDNCGVKVEEPLAVCPVASCDCPEPVYLNLTGKPECPTCEYKIWENRVSEINRQLKEALLQYELNCR